MVMQGSGFFVSTLSSCKIPSINSRDGVGSTWCVYCEYVGVSGDYKGLVYLDSPGGT